MHDTNIGIIRAAALRMQQDPASAVAIPVTCIGPAMIDEPMQCICPDCAPARAFEETNLLGNYRRVVAEETRYLVDALHALRNGSPEVTDEFLDRAILTLTRLRAE